MTDPEPEGAPTPATPPAPTRTPLTPYQWKLFAFLSVACFFEGYDFFALTQLLPNLRADMALNETQGGALVSAINVGTIAAFFLIRKTDQWGRRRMLTLTIVGYTLCSLLTGFAWDVYSFALFQFLARIFLIAEWAVSMVFAAEEFPADRRGMVIGVIQACNSVGAIVCAGVVPLLLATDLGWRMVYFVGVGPLLIIAVWRRGLRESSRFEASVAAGEVKAPEGLAETWRGLLKVWRTPYARRLLQVGIIWSMTYVCTQSAITFWKEFALAERGFTDADVAKSITIAAVGSMPLIFGAGKLLDVVGRRAGAALIYTVTAVCVVGMYNLETWGALTGMLVLGIFGVSSILPVLNTYTTELFPTSIRADAFSWANSILGRVGYVASPALVAALAQRTSWSLAVSVTSAALVVALGMILLWLPETKGLELEDIAEAPDDASTPG